MERACYLLQLNKEQVQAFDDKIKEIAGSSGWALQSSQELSLPTSDASLDVHAVFTL